MLEFYVDGSCRGNPGKGAYGAIQVVDNKQCKLIFIRTVRYTTSYMVELRAMLMVMMLYKGYQKKIYTDNIVMERGFNSWMFSWMRKPSHSIKYRNLWSLVYAFRANTQVVWVKAHAENRWNNIIDKAVVTASLFADE